MPTVWRAIAFAIPLVVSAGCASGGGPPAPSSDAAVPVRESSPDYVTSAEIQATPVSNAYDLINRLRPRWLQAGGRSGSIGGGVRSQIILVYLDDNRIGSLDALRSLSVGGLTSMRFYDAIRAATILRNPGPDPIAGAIVITTTRTP